jgi:hypothetical protein
MKVLVTGAAGFIGFHTAKRLLDRGETVVGLDNFNDYYDVSLKESRGGLLGPYETFRMERISLEDRSGMEALFAREKFDRVVHLAAQAGVRYSIENPHSYIDSNIVGTLHILEGCRHHGGSRSTRMSTTRSRSMVRPRRPTNSWRTPTRTCTACRRQDSGSSRCTVPGVGRTWRCSCSPGTSLPANPSTSSTTATTAAISPTWTTSSKA